MILSICPITVQEQSITYALDNKIEYETTINSSYQKPDFEKECNDLNYAVGNLIEEYNTNKRLNYVELCCSFEKEDKILSIDIISNLYYDIPLEKRSVLDDYISLYGSFTKDEDLLNAYKRSIETINSNSVKQQKIPCNKKSKSYSYNSTYYPDYAVSYARNHWKTYNNNYPTPSGGDCANFVSQCLSEGGLKQDNYWYFHSKTDYSTSWIRAKGVKELLDYKSYKDYTYSTSDIKNNIKSIIKDTKITKGDVIVLCGGFRYWLIPYHVMLVNRKTNNQLYYTAHTVDRFDAALTSHLDDDEYVILYDIAETYNTPYK